jgi:hypothetical protein
VSDDGKHALTKRIEATGILSPETGLQKFATHVYNHGALLVDEGIEKKK